MEPKEYEHCKGCAGIERICAFWQYNPNGECPCTQCILKPMCKMDCKDLKTFVDDGLPDTQSGLWDQDRLRQRHEDNYDPE